MKKRWSENREAMLEIVKRARKASVESIKLFGRKPNSAESIARMAATKRLRCDQAERERLSKVQKKLWSDPKYRAKMSFVHLGKTLSEAAKKKLSLFHKGKPKSREMRDKLSESIKGHQVSLEARKKISETIKTCNNPNWRENVGIDFKKIRDSYEYFLWRDAVYKRDGYRCAQCGATDRLEAHHIKALVRHPELACAIDNGQTLCRSCHEGTDSYGGFRQVQENQ